MTDGDAVSEYRSKRDLDSSPEPDGDHPGGGDRPVFVIQEHRASSHHFDLRIEVDGVLASWAVPKGPSTDPRERRLAVRTEDHPLEYGDFEGVIPEEEYGGGTVLVWDRGTYRNLRADEDEDGSGVGMSQALADGKVEVWLEGDKLSGGYALVRTGGDDDDRWLLIKMDDGEADARRRPTSTEPESVLSGRDLDQVEAQEGTQRGNR